MPTLSDSIKEAALQFGFHTVGIARVPPEISPLPSQGKPSETFSTFQNTLYSRLVNWLCRGYQGAMGWMSQQPERRSNPQAIFPECQSLISLGMNYYSSQFPNETHGYGRIARYAWGKDYHKVFNRRLKELEKYIHQLVPDAHTRRYVDTGPVMEKAWAQQAGLGWIGKHSNLVSSEFGSWLLLGEILTNFELEPDEPGTDLCGSCSLCIQACPTGAITEPYVVDAQKCISYLTIEFREELQTIPKERQSEMGNRIFGCDDCLDICPFNVHEQSSNEPDFQPSSLSLNPHLETLRQFSAETFDATFRHSPIRRAKFNGFMRNVTIAQQNAKLPSSITSIPQ